eukprot:718503_1
MKGVSTSSMFTLSCIISLLMVPLSADPYIQCEPERTPSYECFSVAQDDYPPICEAQANKPPGQKKYHYQSCLGCNWFFQCDEHGGSFDMPCAPGTEWDDNLGPHGGQVHIGQSWTCCDGPGV